MDRNRKVMVEYIGDPPYQAYEGDAGWDISCSEDTACPDGHLVQVPTGIRVALPEGSYGRLVGRSSAISRGLLVVEGIIDSGYRGDLLIRVFNIGRCNVNIKKGERLAQLVVSPFLAVEWQQVISMSPGSRGNRGFGSSGK